MSWQKYDLVFRLLSPLHIGWRKVGNLMQTRPYVPGKALWAALTARLTRDAGHGADGQRYVKIGDAVNHYFRFGYLYPTLAPNGAPWYPWQDEPRFAWRFLDSYAGTALNYDQQAAEEGLLHETECIRPYARRLPNEESAPQVYLAGDLLVRTELPAGLQGWQDALTRLQLGGERGYGWGRVKLVNCDKLVGVPISGEPTGAPVNGHITAHLLAEQVSGVAGPVEPLIGWERNNQNGAPWKLSDKAIICYAPGSKVTADGAFRIGANGIWAAA